MVKKSLFLLNFSIHLHGVLSLNVIFKLRFNCFCSFEYQDLTFYENAIHCFIQNL